MTGPRKFKHHYTREQVRKMLPEMRESIQGLQQWNRRLKTYEQRLENLMAGGADVGGVNLHESLRCLAEIRSVLLRFQEREILIKDLERGLLDFPCIIGGKEVFLCWETDEEDVKFWHDIDSGYASREEI